MWRAYHLDAANEFAEDVPVTKERGSVTSTNTDASQRV